MVRHKLLLRFQDRKMELDPVDHMRDSWRYHPNMELGQIIHEHQIEHYEANHTHLKITILYKFSTGERG